MSAYMSMSACLCLHICLHIYICYIYIYIYIRLKGCILFKVIHKLTRDLKEYISPFIKNGGRYCIGSCHRLPASKVTFKSMICDTSYAFAQSSYKLSHFFRLRSYCIVYFLAIQVLYHHPHHPKNGCGIVITYQIDNHEARHLFIALFILTLTVLVTTIDALQHFETG